MLQRLGNFKDIFISCRIHHYIKNLFIFLPAFFAFKIHEPNSLLQLILAFVAFSLAASSIYILNDIFDKENDSFHPIKKKRPIASGRLKTRHALIFAFLLFFVSNIISYTINLGVLYLISSYVALNILYSRILKNYALLDVITISIGFVIRIFVGGYASDVDLTHWIVILSFILSLFLALSKRLDELINQHNAKTRESTNGYSLEFINSSLSILGGMVVISYVLWSISPDVTQRMNSENIYLSSVFVLIGVLRYLQNVYTKSDTKNPTDVLISDRFLQSTVLLWLISIYFLVYIS